MAIRRFRSRATAGRVLKLGTLAELISLADIRNTVNRGDGGIGTLQGCVDSAGVNQGTTGLLVAGTFYATGWWDGASYEATPDFPAVGNVYNDTVDGVAGTLTLPATSVVLTEAWGGPATYGVAGTGSTPQATIPLANDVLYGSGQYGKFGALLTPNYYAPSDVAGVTTTTTFGVGNAESGTLDLSLYTLISGVVAAADVRFGVARYSGGGNGTLVGIVDSAGNQHDYGTCSSTQEWDVDGIIHTSGTAATSGILTSGGGYYATGILASANTYYSYGTFSLAGAYNATGVIYGVGFYATEASRNNATAGAGKILTGYSVTIAGVTTNGTYVPIADSDIVDGGVSYGDGEVGTGVNATTAQAAAAAALAAFTGDTGITLAKSLEMLAAFMAGKVTAVSAGGITTYTYKKRDGSTTSFTAACSETDGTRATTGSLT